MAYIIAQDKMQPTFLPNIIDDYVGQQDPVRAYDAFVEALDLESLGIPIEQCKAGADEYHPKPMLKLLVYGYSYGGTRSSRKLERACHHNLSFMWLMNNLKPDYRTIARFRSDHKEAIKRILKQCVHICIKLNLIDGNALFTDGSKFRADASIDNSWTIKKCEEFIKKSYKRIDKLIDNSEQIDQDEEKKESSVKIKEQIQDKERLIEKVREVLSTLEKSDKQSVNSTDPECVRARSRQGTHAVHNVQASVDEKHGLIVHVETVEQNNDLNQLNEQITKSSQNLNNQPKVVCADAGYHSMQDLEKVDKDITLIVPSSKQAQKEKGRHPLKPFDKEQFRYDKDKDEYICPEGKSLKYIRPAFSNPRKKSYMANGRECRNCRNFGVCTTSKVGRQVVRLLEEEFKEHLGVIYQSPAGQNIYKLRKEKCELIFGHMKRNLGAGQFMLRGKAKVDAEVSLLSTCFNLSRMISLIGIPRLILRLSNLKRLEFFVNNSIKRLFYIFNPDSAVIYQRTVVI